MKLTNLIFTLIVAMFVVNATFAQDGIANPYTTQVDVTTNMCMRMFADGSQVFAPTTTTTGVAQFEISYSAGVRNDPGEAKIFVWATNRFVPGKVRLAINVVSGNSYPTRSPKWTDANGFVVAFMANNGNMSHVLQTLLDTSEGVFDESGQIVAQYDSSRQSDVIYVEFEATDAQDTVSFWGRPATTDSCPTCSMTLKVQVLEGQVNLGKPMIGDNQVFLTRQVNESRLLQQVQFAQPRVILLPSTQQYVLATDRRVEQMLRIADKSQSWQLLRQVLIAQLQCVAKNLGPFVTAIGQKTTIDSQLFRSAAMLPETSDQIIFHGGSTVGGLAINIARAYAAVRADPANASDLNGILPFINQLYCW